MSWFGEVWDRRFAEQGWPSDPGPYLVELAGPLPVGRGVDLGATVTTVHADLAAWKPDQASFHLAVVANLHPGPAALAAVLATAARALKPGGHLYVVGHHISNLGRHGPPDPDRLLTTPRLRQALPEDITVELVDTRTRTADHGPGGASTDTVVLDWATKPPTAGHKLE